MATQVTTGLLANNAVTDEKLHADFTATTQSASDNSTSVATTAYVTTAIANLADSAPSTLNTLNELAAALGDDANFSTTVTNSIATKLPLAGGTLTGNLGVGGDLTLGSDSVASKINILGDVFTLDVDSNGNTGGTPNMRFAISGSEKVRIDSSGNVGIGTTSPQVPLHVSHATAPSFRLSRTGTGQIYQFGIDSSGRFSISEAASEGGTKYQRFVIDDSGEVGIGSTAPNGLLHIGAANAVGDATNPALQIGPAAGNTYRLGLYTSSEGGVLENKNGDDGIQFRVKTAGEAMRIDGGTGSVGIGETSPDRLFHVKRSDSGGTVAKFENSAGTVYVELNTNNQAGGDAGYISYDSSMNLGLWTDDTQRVTIDSDGKVGIGNTSPAAELHVNKTNAGGLGGRLLISNASSSSGTYCQLIMAPTASTADTRCVIIQAENTDGNNNQDMVFKTSAGDSPAERMRIESEGDVYVSANSDGNEFRVNSTGSGGNDAGLSTKLPGYNSNLYSNFFSTGNNIYFVLAGSYVGYIAGNGNYYPSDQRLKKNVTDLSGSLDKIKQLRGVNFEWIDERTGGNNIGFIAQEVESIIPEVVGDGGLPNTEDGEAPMKNVSYEHIVPHLVEAIKELEARVKELEG